MKNYVAVSFIGTAIAASSVALAAVASATPSGPSSVDQTVQTLQSSGYHVIVNRIGDAPMSRCTVSGVRQGQTHSTHDSRGGSSINETITSRTVYVDVAC
jgi:hypothetical protein